MIDQYVEAVRGIERVLGVPVRLFIDVTTGGVKYEVVAYVPGVQNTAKGSTLNGAVALLKRRLGK